MKVKSRNTEAGNIWEKRHIAELLEQPVGAPIELSLEEAIEIVRLAAGRRPDFPDSMEVLKEIRPNLGKSLEERAGRRNG